MKILSTIQIREADQYTIKNEPIASIDLMERASLAFVELFTEYFSEDEEVWVYCGTGNNGGDGLAIVRLLYEQGYDVQAYLIACDNYSLDNKINQERLSKIVDINVINSRDDIQEIPEEVVVIDALFGSGLSRAIEGVSADVIKSINHSEAVTVAVDTPSGLFADEHIDSEVVVEADLTISFQFPKLAFMMPSLAKYVGEWEVVDIDLMEEFTSQCDTDYELITHDLVETWFKPRSKNSHKGTYGKAMLIAGSYGKMGAAVLAARAAMRSGLGLLTVHTPTCGYEILQTSIPEAMVSVDPTEFYFGEVPNIESYDAIGIGPGLDQKSKTVKAFEELLKQQNQPMVIDADALNVLSANRHLLSLVSENSIFTPHHREFERLAGTWGNDFERLKLQVEFSKQHKVIVAFKGPHTTITTPEGQVYFNDTGNPGMATGGSGDVLTGLITGLLTQGYTSEQATIIGIYLHGLAGDMVADEKGMSGMIASDIVEAIPEAIELVSGY